MTIDHEVQLSILRELLFNPSARFAQLNKTDLTNDHFTFHIKQLLDKGLIEKKGDKYILTPSGLEIAGRLDVKTMNIVTQPKVGVSICATRKRANLLEVLIGRRLRDPNKGECGFYAEKVRFGESLLETAARGLFNETGLRAKFKFAGTLRVLQKVNGNVVFDRLMSCFRAYNLSGDFQERTIESENFWTSYQNAYKLSDRFKDFDKDLDNFKSKEFFFEERIIES